VDTVDNVAGTLDPADLPCAQFVRLLRLTPWTAVENFPRQIWDPQVTG